MPLSLAARLRVALALTLWAVSGCAFAADGHDHGHSHGTAARSPSTTPQVSASSESFALSGSLQNGRLHFTLTNRKDGSLARNARVEMTIDGATAQATPLSDGRFVLERASLAEPGSHEIVIAIQLGTISDLLVATLDSGAPEPGHPTDGVTDTFLVSFARQPAAVLGVALALLAAGFAIGLKLSGRQTGLVRTIFGIAALAAVGSLVAGMIATPARETASAPAHDHKAESAQEGAVAMTAAQIEGAKIRVEAALSGTLSRRLAVPAVVVPDARKLARVPAQVVGTIAEINKQVGDFVQRGEVIAIISSREVADAKSEYLAASVNLELQKTLHDRSLALWEKRITAEQQYLQVKATHTQAQLRFDLARQKLSSLGLDATVVAEEAKQDSATTSVSRLRTYEVRSPISGRVVERKVDIGTPVGKEGDASELYLIADLSAVWAELSVPLGDLDLIKEGLGVTIIAGEKTGEGKLVFVSPIIGAETRSARVIAAFENTDMQWRPGTFVTAHVSLDTSQVPMRVPRTALQTIEGKQVVFVRTKSGFEKREVTLGRADDRAVEVVGGLSDGELIATTNTFLLKADLGKSEAEHSH